MSHLFTLYVASTTRGRFCVVFENKAFTYPHCTRPCSPCSQFSGYKQLPSVYPLFHQPRGHSTQSRQSHIQTDLPQFYIDIGHYSTHSILSIPKNWPHPDPKAGREVLPRRATMARRYSPPDSPLSSMGSGSEGYDEDGHEEEEGSLRPSKRQKVDAQSTTSSAIVPEVEHEVVPGPDTLEGMSDVSSDTSGDIPSSPVNARLEEDDFQDQVSICDWDGCPAGDQGDMDKLVEHIHNSHIENRQKKYTCEWKTCSRKGLPHASGYALKAHMRSHTREKPFYCYLPGKRDYVCCSTQLFIWRVLARVIC